jgi:anti-sigma factor RsiW
VTCEQVERAVDAYMDRELDPAAASAIREHLPTCHSCQHLVAQREALGRLVRAVPAHEAPARLRARVIAQGSRAMWYRRATAFAAAAILVLAVGGGVVFMGSLTSQNDAVVAEVVDSHVRSLMAAHLFDVQSTDQHTVKPWFLGKLDFSPPVVDLASSGFPLVGGRLDYLGGRSVAALVYERRKHTINLFVSPTPAGDPAPIESRSVRGFHVHHWTRGGMAFWAVSDVNDDELTQFIRALQSP